MACVVRPQLLSKQVSPQQLFGEKQKQAARPVQAALDDKQQSAAHYWQAAVLGSGACHPGCAARTSGSTAGRTYHNKQKTDRGGSCQAQPLAVQLSERIPSRPPQHNTTSEASPASAHGRRGARRRQG